MLFILVMFIAIIPDIEIISTFNNLIGLVLIRLYFIRDISVITNCHTIFSSVLLSGPLKVIVRSM